MCDREEPVHCFTSEPVVEMVKEAVETDARTEELAARLNAEPKKQLSEAQLRQLRNLYFTVRHHRVQPCGHLLDQINEPTFRNCEACWFCFFNSHGQLVEVTDKAFQEQGRDFLVKMRGERYAKMFTRFMSTVARMKRESDEQQRSEIQSSGSLGQGDGQSERGINDVSTAGKQGEPASPVDFEQSNIAG